MLRQLRASKPPSTRITLLARLRENGDAEAWKTFVDLYTPLVYRYCRSRHLQDADSRDVTQQVLAIVHRWIGKFEYDKERGKFRNWLGGSPRMRSPDISGGTAAWAKGPATAAAIGWPICPAHPVDPQWAEEFNGYIFQLALSRIQPEFEPEVWQAFALTWLGDVKPRWRRKRSANHRRGFIRPATRSSSASRKSWSFFPAMRRCFISQRNHHGPVLCFRRTDAGIPRR